VSYSVPVQKKLLADPILRDFFITKEGWIFSVSDYFHPAEGIRSILRYVPDQNGERISKEDQKSYHKLDFNDSFQYLKENHREWIFEVCLVPRDEIVRILKPNDAVLDILSKKRSLPEAFELIHRFKEAAIPVSSMGISGSVLPGLDNESSDIDFVVYGNDWFLAKEALKRMKQADVSKSETIDFKISDLDDAMWHTVYKKRKSPLSFDDFFAHEIRKGNRGMFLRNGRQENIYFDLLFVRSPDQIQFPILRGIDTSKTEIEAIVIDASFSFDNPAVYLIEHDEIDEIYSYTHTYAGQALKGETVRARGIVEIIGDKKRLVIGTSRQVQDEWMISLTLLEK
jgi:predicted nucleotidyltransferase